MYYGFGSKSFGQMGLLYCKSLSLPGIANMIKTLFCSRPRHVESTNPLVICYSLLLGGSSHLQCGAPKIAFSWFINPMNTIVICVP